VLRQNMSCARTQLVGRFSIKIPVPGIYRKFLYGLIRV
jgi:hypothetical protein